LARAVSDEPLSSEILVSVKELLVKAHRENLRKKPAKTEDTVLTRHPRRATRRTKRKPKDQAEP
jgi:hypothetical protein